MTTTAESDADRLLERALEAGRRDDTDAAVSLFDQAAKAAPGWALPHYLAGVELAQAGRVDEAEAALARAVLLGPTLDMARFQLGLLQLTSGRVAVAMMTWQPLAELPPTSALQRFVTGLAALTRDEFATARQCLLEGLAANRDNAPLNADMQMVLARIDRLEAAAAAPGAADESTSDENMHVLLSNYERQGRSH